MSGSESDMNHQLNPAHRNRLCCAVCRSISLINRKLMTTSTMKWDEECSHLLPMEKEEEETRINDVDHAWGTQQQQTIISEWRAREETKRHKIINCSLLQLSEFQFHTQNSPRRRRSRSRDVNNEIKITHNKYCAAVVVWKALFYYFLNDGKNSWKKVHCDLQMDISTMMKCVCLIPIPSLSLTHSRCCQLTSNSLCVFLFIYFSTTKRKITLSA